jgi:hypothetical protein
VRQIWKRRERKGEGGTRIERGTRARWGKKRETREEGKREGGGLGCAFPFSRNTNNAFQPSTQHCIYVHKRATGGRREATTSWPPETRPPGQGKKGRLSPQRGKKDEKDVRCSFLFLSPMLFVQSRKLRTICISRIKRTMARNPTHKSKDEYQSEDSFLPSLL